MYLHVQKWTSVKLNLFRGCLARDRKSPGRGNVANVFGQGFRETSVRQTAWVQRYFIRSQWNTAELLFGSSGSTEICIKLFTRSSRNKRHLFSISLSFCQTNLLSSPRSRYLFDIKKLFEIDALKVIPGETRDYLLRISIDLPESRSDFRQIHHLWFSQSSFK